MKTSEKGLLFLISNEGIVENSYRDSVGIWTIGVGHTKAAGGIDPATYTGTMTLDEIIDLFRVDIAKYEAAVNAAIKVPLTQNEFDALVSFHYNTGGIARASLTLSINAGDKATAGKQFLNWLKPPEIEGRRKKEMALFLDGTYAIGPGVVYPAVGGKVQWSRGRKVDLLSVLRATPVPPDVPAPKPEPQMPIDTPPVKPVEQPKTLWALIGQFLTSIFKKD